MRIQRENIATKLFYTPPHHHTHRTGRRAERKRPHRTGEICCKDVVGVAWNLKLTHARLLLQNRHRLGRNFAQIMTVNFPFLRSTEQCRISLEKKETVYLWGFAKFTDGCKRSNAPGGGNVSAFKLVNVGPLSETSGTAHHSCPCVVPKSSWSAHQAAVRTPPILHSACCTFHSTHKPKWLSVPN